VETELHPVIRVISLGEKISIGMRYRYFTSLTCIKF